jgi:hypothetical protein
LVLVVRVVEEHLTQLQHKMEVIQYLAPLHPLAVVVAIMLVKMVEMAGQAAAVAVVALLLVLVAQATHQAHHQVKVVAVELRLLTTPSQVLALAVAVALVVQQHQMAQMHRAQRLAMAQMEQRLPFLVHR